MREIIPLFNKHNKHSNMSNAYRTYSNEIERVDYPRFKADIDRGSNLKNVIELETEKDIFYQDELSKALNDAKEYLKRIELLSERNDLMLDEAVTDLINEEVKAIKIEYEQSNNNK
jgi:hypothetical protein